MYRCGEEKADVMVNHVRNGPSDLREQTGYPDRPDFLFEGLIVYPLIAVGVLKSVRWRMIVLVAILVVENMSMIVRAGMFMTT